MLKKQHLTIHGFLKIAKLRDGINIIGKQRAVGRSKYKDYEWFKKKLLGNSKLDVPRSGDN